MAFNFFKRTPGQAEMSFIEHLEALRWHIVRSVLAILIIAIFCFLKIDWIFEHVIMGPLKQDFASVVGLCNLSHFLHIGNTLCLPAANVQLQTTAFGSQFISSITISFVCGFIVAFPYVFWEFWRFVKPALSPKEIKSTRGSIFFVTFFFLLGISFGYFLLAPFTFSFLSNYKLGLTGMLITRPTLDDYLDNLLDILIIQALPFITADQLCTHPYRRSPRFSTYLPQICLCGYSFCCCGGHALARLDEPDHRCPSSDSFI
jgi:sec-independent protein translocase protein TatC